MYCSFRELKFTPRDILETHAPLSTGVEVVGTRWALASWDPTCMARVQHGPIRPEDIKVLYTTITVTILLKCSFVWVCSLHP